MQIPRRPGVSRVGQLCGRPAGGPRSLEQQKAMDDFRTEYIKKRPIPPTPQVGSPVGAPPAEAHLAGLPGFTYALAPCLRSRVVAREVLYS
jgi:hypothetical protein